MIESKYQELVTAITNACTNNDIDAIINILSNKNNYELVRRYKYYTTRKEKLFTHWRRVIPELSAQPDEVLEELLLTGKTSDEILTNLGLLGIAIDPVEVFTNYFGKDIRNARNNKPSAVPGRGNANKQV